MSNGAARRLSTITGAPTASATSCAVCAARTLREEGAEGSARQLALVPPDPMGVADAWERFLVRLESIGAAVESEREGLACFDASGLLRREVTGTGPLWVSTTRSLTSRTVTDADLDVPATVSRP